MKNLFPDETTIEGIEEIEKAIENDFFSARAICQDENLLDNS